MACDRQTVDMDFEAITLRRAQRGDGRTLARLAELDSTPLPDDEFLVGEVSGVPWAAIGINTGVLVADPFRPTAELAGLLRLRAQPAHAAAARSWRGRGLVARRPPAAVRVRAAERR
jgi:hypothetical protein